MCLLAVPARFDYRKLAESDRNFLIQRFVETYAFPGCIIVTNGRRDLGIGANERSWLVDVPLQFRSPETTDFCQNVQYTGFSKYERLRARIFLKEGHRDLVIGLNERY